MRRALPPAAGLLAGLIAAFLLPTASAEVYHWKDGGGRTVISDTPPPAASKAARLPSAAGDDAAPAASLAEKDLEFRKRRQEAGEKAEKEAKAEAATTERKAGCGQARGQLAGLEAGEAFAVRDESGKRRHMESSERQREIERTRKFIGDNCP